MSSIDQRIVEMQFDNRQFESGVKTTISTLDRLKQKLNFGKSAQSLDDLSKASKRFSLDGLASSVEYIASKFSFMGVMGVTAMQRISNAAITTGKRLVSALTIDPVRSGLSEYETQIRSVQTILSNTRSKGTTLDQVNAALDELNAYADRTIYNFTEMTRNIGTFTAAGVDLDTSVAAIKGISNLAAVSGSTPQQAATAMYQLSQALASGTIRLMDWNSVVNAGMGGEVFQDALKETARVHGIAIDDMIKKEGSFRETLQNGWLTSEIMLETLQKFTGDLSKEQILAMGYTEDQANEIIALGKDANDAATKVKTFSDLIDTTKEALGSGWAQSWEFIIGDFEAARTLWTDVSNALNEIIGESADARNSMLKAWADAGGRADLIEGLTDIFGALWNIVTAVGDAMDDIFPPMTVDTLLNISSGVKEFGDNLQRLFGIIGQGTSYTGEDITTTETVGGVDFFGDSLSKGARNEAVKKLQQYLKDAGYDLGNAGIDGIFGPATEAALKEFQESVGIVADGVYDEDTHNALMKALGLGPEEITTVEKGTKTVNFFTDALQRLRNIAKGAFAILDIAWKGIQFVGNIIGHVLTLLAPVGDVILAVAEGIAGCFVNLNEWLEESGLFGDWLDSIVEFLRPVGDWFESVGQSIKNFFGFGDEVDEANGEIKTFATLWNKIKKSVSNLAVWDRLADAWGALKEAFAEIAPVIQEYWNTAKEWIGEKFGDLLDWIVEKVPEAAEKIGEFFTKIVEWAKPGIQKIPELFAKIGNAFRGLFDSVDENGKRVPGVLSRVGSFFTGLYEQVKNSKWAQTAITNVSNFLSSAWEKIKEIVSDISAWVSELFSGDSRVEGEKAGENLRKSVEPVVTVFDWLKEVWTNKIFPALKSIYDWISKFAMNVGPGGIVAAIIGVIGALKAFKFISSITKMVWDIGSVFTSIKSMADSGKKAFDTINKNFGKGKDSIKDIAESIAIIVAAIYVLGSMDIEIFKRGTLTLVGIMAVLLIFQKLSGMLSKGTAVDDVKSIGSSIKSAAMALLVLSASIRLLGGMDPWDMAQGIAGLIFVMGILTGFIAVMKKVGGESGKINLNMKGFFSLALAIAIIVGIMKLINTFHFWDFVGGLLGIIAVLGVLTVAINSMSSLSGGVKINMRGFFSLALAIGVLVGVMKLITSVFKDIGEYLLGLAGVAGVMVALAAFGKLISRIDISPKSAASLLILSVVIGILSIIMVAIGQVSWDTIGKGVVGLIGVMGSLAIFALVLSKLSSGIKIGSSLVLILGFVAVIAAFGLVMNAIKDVDPSVMISFAESLALGLAALTAACLVAGKLGGVATMASGAAGIGVAISIIVAIGVALVAALGAIDELTKGGLTKLLDSGAKVLESFGKAIGALVGGFVSGFIGPVGEALESLSNGLEGLGSNDNLDEDIDKAIEAVKSIGEFITTIQGMDVERNPGFLFKFYIGDNKTNSLLSQIEQFGVALGEVAGALQGLEGLDATDIQFAIDAVNSIGTFVTTIKDKDVEVEPGLFKKFFGDETKTMSLLDQIKEFGTTMDKIGNYVLWYKNNGIDDTDSDNMITIATKITDFIATIRANYPEDGAGVPDDLFNPYYSDLMTQVEEFGKAMGEVKNGIAGVGEGGENELTDDDIETAEKAVEHISEWIGELDERLNGLENIETTSSWFEKTFVGENATESLFAQVSRFAESVGAIKTNLTDISNTLDDDDVPTAVEAAEKVSEFILGLSTSEGMKEVQNNYADVRDYFMSISDMFTSMEDFSTSMVTVRDNLLGLAETSLVDDAGNAITVADILTGFIGSLGDETEIEKVKGDFAKFFTGDTTTGSIMSYLNQFTTIMGGAVDAFSGISAAGFEDDMNTAINAVKSFMRLLVTISGGDEEFGSFDISNLLASSQVNPNNEDTVDMIGQYLSSIASSINNFDSLVGDVDQGKIQSITSFIDGITTAFSSAEGAADLSAAIESFKSLFSTDEDGVGLSIDSWMASLDSTAITTKLSEFTTSVGESLTTNTESLSGQISNFETAGNKLASAVSGGLGSDVDTTGVSNLCSALINAIIWHKSDFYTAGWHLSSGVAQGIYGGGGLVKNAARSIISNALSAMRAEADEASPSKETEKIAQFMDMGLVNGLEGYSHIVSRAAEGVAGEALDSTRNTLANLSTVLSEDMDTTPVIRPVMDMSNISAGARTINGIFSGGRTLSVGVTAAKAQAASAAMRESRKRQNGMDNATSNVSNSNDSSVNLSGNNFYVRSDQDVRALASEIAALTRQQQRSYGMSY